MHDCIVCSVCKQLNRLQTLLRNVGEYLQRVPRRLLTRLSKAYHDCGIWPAPASPQGSKDPNDRVLGPKYYHPDGILDLKRHYLGPWTLGSGTARAVWSPTSCARGSAGW